MRRFVTRPVLASLAAVAAVAAAPRGARGERVGAIVIPTVDAPVDAMALTAALAARVDEPDALAAVVEARRAGAQPRAALDRFAEVANLVGEGWRAYVAADPEFAAARLAAARTAAEELLVLSGGEGVYADTCLRLGIALLHLGQRDRASDALRLAHALDPDRAVTAAEFLPDAVAAYDAAIAVTPPTVAVRIDALAGAAIVLDGRAIGRAPLTLDLAIGAHVIAVTADGYQPYAHALELTAATPLVAIELVPDRGAVAAARAARAGLGALGERDTAAAIDAIVTLADVDAVLLVASTVRAGAPALLGQRCTGGAACTAVVEVGYPLDGDLGAALGILGQRLAGAEPRYRVTLPGDVRVRRGDGAVGPGPDRTGGRARWYWIGGGVALAAIATAVVLAATTRDDPPVVTIDPDDFTRLTAP